MYVVGLAVWLASSSRVNPCVQAMFIFGCRPLGYTKAFSAFFLSRAHDIIQRRALAWRGLGERRERRQGLSSARDLSAAGGLLK
jgi:hypothetical protein